MTRKLMILMAALLLIPMGITAQTYQQWWKRVGEAQTKDLPKTAIQHLQKIKAKAQRERAYGQLLKSTLLHARLQAEVAPDSLRPAVSKLESQFLSVTDPVLKAVYATVLTKVYDSNPQLGDDADAQALRYRQQAKAHPEILAAQKADAYEPFVVKGKDSQAFGDDLLSVVGAELDEWQWLQDYYTQKGNRRALCHLALRTANSLKDLDSLAALYGDLPEANVIAKKRQNLWTGMTYPMYQMRLSQQVVMPDEAQTVKLFNLRNITTLTLHVYRTKLKGNTELNINEPKDLARIKAGMTEVTNHSRTVTFSKHPEQEEFEDSVVLDGLTPGVYLLECTSPGMETARALYYVSSVRVMTQVMPQDQMRYVVVDARTGQPLSNAILKLTYRSGWNLSKRTEEQACNLQGEVLVKQEKQRPSAVYAYTPADDYCPSIDCYGRYAYYDRQNNTEHTNLFTDRSIYRPGQTVHVAAIVWKEQSPVDNVAVGNKPVKLELRDANYKLLAEKQVTTDAYGKCATAFTLPTGLLNGLFTIRASGASTSFSVEEYKRPTFQVEFPEYNQSYQNGDTVRAQAKALSYAGVPVQGAKVHYTVKRRVAFWWMSYSRYWQGGYMGRGLQEEVMNEAETTTADDGTFTVEMPMLLPDDLGSQSMFYHFVVEAVVTDMAGETHSGAMTLPLGTKSTALTCDLPGQVRKDQLPEVTFTRRNAAGKEIAGMVRYRLDGGKWKECAANAQLSLTDGQSVALHSLPSCLSSGEHRLEAVCERDTVDLKFVVFGLDDKVPATQTHDWFYVSHTQFPGDGSPVTLQVGSSDPDLHIVYGIYAGDKVLESGSVERSASLLNRQFTYKEEYGNGLLLTYAWVKDGQCYRHQQTIMRPMPDKRLTMTWETFRDRLTPGQHEEWRLKIQTPDGKLAQASLLAVLYDKSLDQIREHQWNFTPSTYLPMPSTNWQWRLWGSLGLSSYKPFKLQDVPAFDYSHFDSSVYPYYHYSIRVRGAKMMYAKAAKASARMVSNAVIGSSDVIGNDEVAMADVEQSSLSSGAPTSEESRQKEQVQLRENLNETAFYYPQLETDREGGVALKFTLPESLTTWRFMGVANTADMLYGYMGAEAVAKKDVMVQPNMPRFIREGDEAQFAARIINTSDHVTSGNVLLQLLNPDDNSIVYEQSHPFSAEAGKTTAANFKIPVTVLKPSLLICKVMAIGDGFSDGEQHYLPVLSNSEYVTKTVPFTQHEPGVKTVDMTTLFPLGTTQQKLTVEYTNNPAWLMVQALPVIGHPHEDSAIDQAASYYSNLLAKTLLSQSPQVKAVFEQWKREDAQRSSLTSHLTQNQELKDLVLNETPWVAAADRESEQKQRLADFFDENTISNRLATAVEKLQKLQNPDGSFSWYPGMEGSTYITVAIEEMLVRLNQMAGQQQDMKALHDKAFSYIGREMVGVVSELKKQEKKGHKPIFPSFTALRWLYLAALDGRQLSADVKSANDYLIRLLKKDIKRQTMYEKALTAVVLAKHGEQKLAAGYVQSLKEYTIYTEEMGRYYDTPRASYSWYDYKIPTEVAAIEAIQTVMPQDLQTVDEMRRWLLQEKRTQAWDTPINSVNAIWSFLHGKSNLIPLGNQAHQSVLAIDQQPLELPQATAGLGYVKTAISHPQGHTFTATKTNEGTSWGAVYAQFLQKTSEVSASQSGITIKREVLSQCPLSVGDRVKVRITIESTRDLDFVQVVDRRAACMEPVRQLSGYQQGAYVSPKDYATYYFYSGLSKGKHVIETEYYIDRAGQYESGTCTVGCAYAPEFRAMAPSVTILVNK